MSFAGKSEGSNSSSVISLAIFVGFGMEGKLVRGWSKLADFIPENGQPAKATGYVAF